MEITNGQETVFLAASMALAKGDTRAIDIARLRDRLKDAGAIL